MQSVIIVSIKVTIIIMNKCLFISGMRYEMNDCHNNLKINDCQNEMNDCHREMYDTDNFKVGNENDEAENDMVCPLPEVIMSPSSHNSGLCRMSSRKKSTRRDRYVFSSTDFDQHPYLIFDKIEDKDYNEVSKILSLRGQKVDIVPKIGCSDLHYSRVNIANRNNEQGDTPLIAASRINYRMVELIIRYGGNPNFTNKKGDSPLSIAAVRGDRNSVDALLSAGANLNDAVIRLTSYLTHHTDNNPQQAGFETGFSAKPLTFLLSNDPYLKCRDPFRTAFDVSKSIEALVNVRDEFRMEFELLIQDADVFAYKMLDYCERMWEAREVLDVSHGLLKKAIDDGKKRFVGHPFSQQIILEEWYGEITSKSSVGQVKVAVRCLLSPILLIWYLCKFTFYEQFSKVPIRKSSAARHMNFIFIPFICFVTDILNYLILLGLTISTCVCSKTIEYPHILEITLWCCAASRAFIEIDQMWQNGLTRYLSNMWNVLEIFSCILILTAAIFRISVCLTLDETVDNHVLLKITYLYAITEFLMFLRWLNFLEFFPGLGPLLIALRILIADVFKFVGIVLFTCVLGTAIALYSVVSTARSLDETESYEQISERQVRFYKLLLGGPNYLGCLPPTDNNYKDRLQLLVAQ